MDGFLGPDDPLPGVPRRVLVAGASGAGKYDVVRDLLADRSDLVVWLDLPGWRVLTQVRRRTLTDPEHLIRWSWTSWSRVGPRIVALRRRRPELTVVRLRSRCEVRTWLAGPSIDVRPRRVPRRPGG